MTEPERWSTLVTRVLAPNAGPMTLDGTNTYVIRAPGHSSAVVVDPGPEDAAHLAQLEALGPVELILLTHHHFDHTEAAVAFAARTGAPVRAVDAALCLNGAPLTDGEVIHAGGTRIVVVATPGHTADSVCFHLPDDGPVASGEASGSILTGDTILGRGTTIIARPDGSLREYLHSLEILRGLAGAQLVLPAHGPALTGLDKISRRYAAHRRQRLADVQGALDELGLAASPTADVVAQVTDAVYPNVDPAIRFAAEASTSAQLEYLATGG